MYSFESFYKQFLDTVISEYKNIRHVFFANLCSWLLCFCSKLKPEVERYKRKRLFFQLAGKKLSFEMQLKL